MTSLYNFDIIILISRVKHLIKIFIVLVITMDRINEERVSLSGKFLTDLRYEESLIKPVKISVKMRLNELKG